MGKENTEKKEKKKIKLSADMVIKIITAVIMLGIVIFLIQKNSFVLDDFDSLLEGPQEISFQ